jgi:hypothetical protein
LTTLPLLYVSRLDVREEGKAPFEAWYSRRHAPDLIGVGFLSVSSFRAVRGAPEVCNLYELRDVDAFGEAYVRVRADDEESARLQQNSFNGTLAVHEQVVACGVDSGDGPGPRWVAAVTAPVLGTVLFSSAADDDEVVGFYEGELARLVAEGGAVSARLGRQVDAGRPNREPRPWSAFVEWANLADAGAWADADPVDAHVAALGSVAGEEPLLHVLRRVFTRANPEAWH